MSDLSTSSCGSVPQDPIFSKLGLAAKLQSAFRCADDALARARDGCDGYPIDDVNFPYAPEQVCKAIHYLYGALESLTAIEKLPAVGSQQTGVLDVEPAETDAFLLRDPLQGKSGAA